MASNAALIMVAYDAKGSASHRFTFDPLEEIAHICGFPDDGPDPFGRSSYADTIEIDGCTLTAFRKPCLPHSLTSLLSRCSPRTWRSATTSRNGEAS